MPFPTNALVGLGFIRLVDARLQLSSLHNPYLPAMSRRMTLESLCLPSSHLIAEDLGLTCCVCHAIYHDPVETSCAHVFCRECLLTPRCPICRASLQGPGGAWLTKEPSPSFGRLLRGLKVRCCHASDSKKRKQTDCGWVGAYGDLAAHLSSSCAYEEIPCPQCDVRVARSDLERHVATCVPTTTCFFCGLTVPACQLHEHNRSAALQHVEVLKQRCADLQSRGDEALRRASASSVAVSWAISSARLAQGVVLHSRRVTLDNASWTDTLRFVMSFSRASGHCGVAVKFARSECQITIRVSLILAGVAAASQDAVLDLTRQRRVAWPSFCPTGELSELELKLELTASSQLVRCADSSSSEDDLEEDTSEDA